MSRISRTEKALLCAGSVVTLFVLLAAVLFDGSGLVAGKENPRTRASAPAGTPRPAAPSAIDPLDGDALDGEPDSEKATSGDRNAPERQAQLEFERSGRPSRAASSVVAYDDDPATIWDPGAGSEDAWIWLDLGDQEQVREVRWLASGSGTIEVEISSDRRDWTRVDDAEISGAWQGVALAEEARYIRLTLQSDAEGEGAKLAEVAAYGRDAKSQVSREQKAKRGAGEKRSEKPDRRAKSQDAQSEPKKGGKDEPGKKSTGRISASATRGETRCDGARERCQAREGKVSIEEDCETDGTCTIDVRADGGSAICDAAGGSRTEAGNGAGRKGGEGGECEAVANGGAVTIGDVNP